MNPWCSSNWQQLRYRAVRPSSDPLKPLELLTEKTTIFLGSNEPYAIKIQRRSFEIDHESYQELDNSILVRTHVHKYEISGNAARRIPPFAFAPEDFLDEWMSMQWEDAAHWTAGSNNAGRLGEWHDRLQNTDSREFETEFDFVRPGPSSDQLSRWQIGLILEGTGDKPLPSDMPDQLFFTVVKRDGF